MTFSSSLAFFDHLMNEGDLDEAAFLAFLQARTSDEGLHLDFKSGLELDKPRDRRNFTVKQYVGAFANSEGGVLVIGVKDQSIDEKRRRQPKVLAPITTLQETNVGGDLARWAKDCVADLIGYLGVPPRLKVIEVVGGKVLFVAVPRAPSLVPVIKEGKQAYYFRVEDEAREVYPHLIADLMLGRRKNPLLSVEPMPERCATGFMSNSVTHELVIELAFDVTNDSLVTARDVRVGIVGPFHELRPARRLSGNLAASIEVMLESRHANYPIGVLAGDWGFDPIMPQSSMTLRPFDTVGVRLPARATLFGDTALALYVCADGCEPQWYQVEVPGPQGYLLPNDRTPVTPTVERALRPRVGCGLPPKGRIT